jgi:hypothetical protein
VSQALTGRELNCRSGYVEKLDELRVFDEAEGEIG